MDNRQIKELVAYMAATWRAEFTEAEVMVWAETFDGIDPGHAMEAMRNLKLVKTFLPSHAEFHEAVEAVLHRIERQRAQLPTTTSTPVSREKAKEYIGKIRASLNTVGDGGTAATRAERLAKWGPGMFNGRRIG